MSICTSIVHTLHSKGTAHVCKVSREQLALQWRSNTRFPSVCASLQVKGQRAETQNRTLQGKFSQKTMFKLLMTVNRSIIKFNASCSLFQKLIPSKSWLSHKANVWLMGCIRSDHVLISSQPSGCKAFHCKKQLLEINKEVCQLLTFL